MSDPLLAAATDLVALLSPDRISALADRVRQRRPSDTGGDLSQLLLTATARKALDRLLEEWGSTSYSGEVVAGILMGAAYTRRQIRRESSVELVWTGPTTPYVATRRTEQVLLDLIRRAYRDVFLVSFVAYEVPSVIAELNAASSRGVDVRLLLEGSIAGRSRRVADPVVSMRRRLPHAAIYTWTEQHEPFKGGRVHAKVAVADGDVAFVTSANLTGHALEKNMEAGVLINGGHVPQALREHLRALVETEMISRS